MTGLTGLGRQIFFVVKNQAAYRETPQVLAMCV